MKICINSTIRQTCSVAKIGFDFSHKFDFIDGEYVFRVYNPPIDVTYNILLADEYYSFFLESFL